MIPVNEIYDKYVDSSDGNKVLHPNFEYIGITSTLFIYNMGSLFYFYFAFPLQLLAYFVMKKFTRYTWAFNFRARIWNSMFWQYLIATIKESFMIVVLCVLIDTLRVSNQST